MLTLAQALAQFNAQQERIILDLKSQKLALEAQSRTASPSPSVTTSVKGPKLPKFTEGYEIDVSLRTFEKLALVQGWPESTWATRLAPQLSGKALEAYWRIASENLQNHIV